MPKICVECGQNTMRRVKVCAEPFNKPEREMTPARQVIGFVPGIGMMLFLYEGLYEAVSYGIGRGEWQVVLRVPQCRQCARDGEPGYADVNYVNKTLIFNVHKRFRTQFERDGERRKRRRER